ncbi:porin [uncultured Paraglaciecola sp.]|uniref:porin n=1 Tax=uncultured Paraglaciecola sp. TaxID=1765024 RepID=UPI0030D99A63|tara:strand:+ start:4076 stop:5029 length:954 start_codon:yes stop_codon:yes gene_type:complete
MHVEAETEISLNEAGETEIELEYADIHYFLTDTTTITAGKFLLPFGQFSANWHPSWINRTPWTPGIYGSHGSPQAMTPLLPILSDVGIVVQQTFFFSSKQKIFLDLYVTNGASAEAHDEEEIVDEHVEEIIDEHNEEAEEDEHVEAFPEVEFEATSGDNNKAFGGRIAYAFLPAIEIGASYYTAKYDEDERLDITAQGIDINFIGNHYLIRGEYISTETDGLEEEDEHDAAEIAVFKRNGWFLQGVFQAGQIWPQLGGTELVVEYAKTNKFAEAKRWVAGVNYWLDARSVIKFSYEDTDVKVGDDDQRLAVQYSYGF